MRWGRWEIESACWLKLVKECRLDKSKNVNYVLYSLRDFISCWNKNKKLYILLKQKWSVFIIVVDAFCCCWFLFAFWYEFLCFVVFGGVGQQQCCASMKWFCTLLECYVVPSWLHSKEATIGAFARKRWCSLYFVCCYCWFGGGRKVAFGATHCVTSTDSTAMREKDAFNIMSWCIHSVHDITNTVIVLSVVTIREIMKCWWGYWLTEKVRLFVVVVYLHPFCPSCTHGWTSMKENVIFGGKAFYSFSFFRFIFSFFVLLSFFLFNFLRTVIVLL